MAVMGASLKMPGSMVASTARLGSGKGRDARDVPVRIV
jgi:hypothetical protein